LGAYEDGPWSWRIHEVLEVIGALGDGDVVGDGETDGGVHGHVDEDDVDGGGVSAG